jgi:hypothetical protein
MQVEPRTIVRIVAQEWGVKVSQLTGKCRITCIARPRQVSMYLLRELVRESFAVIGRRFFCDHSTAISACKRVRQLIAADPEFSARVSRIVKAIEAAVDQGSEPESSMCPHCHRHYLDPVQRDAVVTGIKDQLKQIENRVEAFARAS